MDVSLMDAGILAALGYGVVFAGLIVLMIVSAASMAVLTVVGKKIRKSTAPRSCADNSYFHKLPAISFI